MAGSAYAPSGLCSSPGSSPSGGGGGAEHELGASRRERRRLTGRLIEAQEDELRRVARELHDDLSQGLALLAVELDLLACQPPRSEGETGGRLRELSARVRELSSATHSLSHQLHPSKLEELGLVAAVRGLCAELGRHHALTVDFTHTGVPRGLPPAAALCLYRVAQEALRNVVRHSGADRAAVGLIGTPAGVRLVVADGGVGFDPTVHRNGGLGLVSMRERTHLVGGELTIEARPAGGTRIDIRVPAPVPPTADERPAAAGPGRPAPEYDAPVPETVVCGRMAPACCTIG